MPLSGRNINGVAQEFLLEFVTPRPDEVTTRLDHVRDALVITVRWHSSILAYHLTSETVEDLGLAEALRRTAHDLNRAADELLHECQSCSANPGAPLLCERCRTARHDTGPHWLGPRRATTPEPTVIALHETSGPTGTLFGVDGTTGETFVPATTPETVWTVETGFVPHQDSTQAILYRWRAPWAPQPPQEPMGNLFEHLFEDLL